MVYDREKRERIKVLAAREKKLVREPHIHAMAEGDPGLPGGHNIHQIPKANEQRGKWQEGEPEPEQDPRQKKEIVLSLSEAGFSIIGTTFAFLLAKFIPLVGSIFVSLFTGLAIGRGFRTGQVINSGFITLACKLLLGLVIPLTLASVMFPPIGFTFATLLYLLAAGSGVALGYYDSTFGGVRKLYPKSWGV